MVAENANLKVSVDSAATENFRLNRVVENLKSKEVITEGMLADLTSRLAALEKSKDSQEKVSVANKERLLNLERHSRGKNLRFCLKEPERDQENTTALINTELTKVGLHVKIENSHRVGKKTDGKGPRQIIACFLERPERFQVMKKRTELFDIGVKVFEDLCHEDFLLKKKHSAYMQTLHDQGKKVRFARGCWWVNKTKFEGVEDDDLYS